MWTWHDFIRAVYRFNSQTAESGRHLLVDHLLVRSRIIFFSRLINPENVGNGHNLMMCGGERRHRPNGLHVNA